MFEREELGRNIPGNAHFSHKPTNGIGIAFGGGLARGFAHIGVIKTLLKEGIIPQIVSGTSIGSVVGACYLADKLQELEEWALSLNRKTLLSYLDLTLGSPGIIKGKKLNKLLISNFGRMNVQDLEFPYVAVATSLLTGHEVWIQRGHVVEAMRASYSLPGIFAPVERNDRLLIDGALVNPVPTAPCQAMGARITIAVDLNADMIAKAASPGKKYQTVAGFDPTEGQSCSLSITDQMKNGLVKRLFRRPNDDMPSMFGVLFSSLGIMQDRLTRMRLASDPPDIHIKPQIGHIGLAEFEKARELIGEGESATYAALKDIKIGLEMLVPH